MLRLLRLLFPSRCQCRINHQWPFIRSTVRECPVHGDKALARNLKSKYGR